MRRPRQQGDLTQPLGAAACGARASVAGTSRGRHQEPPPLVPRRRRRGRSRGAPCGQVHFNAFICYAPCARTAVKGMAFLNCRSQVDLDYRTLHLYLYVTATLYPLVAIDFILYVDHFTRF